MSSFTDRFIDRFSGRTAPDPFTLAAAGAGLAAGGIALAFWRRGRKAKISDRKQAEQGAGDR